MEMSNEYAVVMTRRAPTSKILTVFTSKEDAVDFCKMKEYNVTDDDGYIWDLHVQEYNPWHKCMARRATNAFKKDQVVYYQKFENTYCVYLAPNYDSFYGDFSSDRFAFYFKDCLI